MTEDSLFGHPDRDPTDLGLIPTPPIEPPHVCSRGWLGENTAGNLVPCLRCKPHLHHDHDGWKVHPPDKRT